MLLYIGNAGCWAAAARSFISTSSTTKFPFYFPYPVSRRRKSKKVNYTDHNHLFRKRGD